MIRALASLHPHHLFGVSHFHPTQHLSKTPRFSLLKRSVCTRFNIKNSSRFIFCNNYSTEAMTDVEKNASAPTPTATATSPGIKPSEKLTRLRNIGISAHIDSGKTTLTERILYYTGRIEEIHEVKGKDQVGAKMDSMDLEREKGITIRSAATHVQWKNSVTGLVHTINIIDTPGHVDFTIEVERALRVLDGAILVLCGVAGVQSQTFTVDRQMRRYKVPRLIFINKLDRLGANPWRALQQIRDKLGLRAAAVQIPIGLEAKHSGVVDIIDRKALYFLGSHGQRVSEEEVPDNLVAEMEDKRQELLEQLAEVDEILMEKLLTETPPTPEEIRAAIRRATIQLKFVPVFMGAAFKNKGVQPLLDGVCSYLPDPTEVENVAFLREDESKKFVVNAADPNLPLIAYAFKLDESRFGQLTYLRIYQGTLKRGMWIRNVHNDKKIKVPRLVKMHADEMEDIEKSEAGDICAMFGVECDTGTTFTDGTVNYLMTSMHVPKPVMSLAITTKSKDQATAFVKALRRFQREDPTFHVSTDSETGEMIISGMGELHLEIYLERMRREYNVQAKVGRPQVAYRETVTRRGYFDVLHKKQSGGQGQYAKLCGYVEPIGEEEGITKEFVNAIVGNAVPPHLIPAVEKGYEDILMCGPLLGFPVERVRMVINDGAFHSVDSTEIAFRICSHLAFKEGFKNANPSILEPIMKAEIIFPAEFQGGVIGIFTRRKGVIYESRTEGDIVTLTGEVPLNNMFGFSTELRSCTQGKGEFTLEYCRHQLVPREQLPQLMELYKDRRRGSILA